MLRRATRLSRWAGALGIVVATATTAEPVDFDRDVRPIFENACVKCHGPEKQKGGYRLDLPEAALKGGDDGVAIVPRHAAESPLIRLIASTDPAHRMPPKGDPLSADQIATLRAWIDQGAAWPGGEVAPAVDHWAFRPLTKPAGASIDSFILSKLEEKGLKPSPPASRRALLRRVTYDLTGLPPTPEELDAFLADESPTAYERVVDRLLTSPRYGERRARRWMDLVHFAETHGNDQDRERPNAWPYRDYLIRSFNSDKPYARFVQEQIAGDVLFPNDPDGIVALGFIAAGPWDESSQMAIQDNTVDKRIARNLDRDDMVMTTMSTFTSTSVHCARCHRHKFDPITQADYYGLQAVFAGVDRADRPYDPDPGVHRRRRELLAQRTALEGGRFIADADAKSWLATWEAETAARRRRWVTLQPQEMSSLGSTLAVQPDGSVTSSGARPEKDVYTITATTDLSAITAIRLELLESAELPHNGPGRQDNGNLHLNSFRVTAGATGDPLRVEPVEIVAARADFDQAGWTIAMSIDGSDGTAWGIYPKVGLSHVGVFDLKRPTGFAGGTRLTFVLEQTHGGGHLIGRLRLSVTGESAALPAEVDELPPAIARVLATPTAARAEADARELTRYALLRRVERDLAALPSQQYVYAATNEFEPQQNFKPARQPRAVSILRRGDVNQPVEVAEPRALSCLAGLDEPFRLADPTDESARRAALARWLVDPRNVLTWRSIVNRAWRDHFGRGMVATPSDFGRMGAAPTHPELLDWLAGWFLEHGGSLKQLDRLIVTSATYRQSSDHVPAFAEGDGENRYLWRMNRPRLEAECVRDALLQICGRLDTSMGGPSAKQFTQKPGVHVTPVLDYAHFDPDAPAARRLGIYRFIYRTLPDPFMDALDYPDASQLTPDRASSTTALQALAMMNDRFVARCCEHLAERLGLESAELTGQIRRAYVLCLGREPRDDETAVMTAFAKEHGLVNFCRLLINTNEFAFID